MFWNKDVEELKRQIATLTEDRNDAWELCANLRQQEAQARNEVDRMKRAYTEEGLNKIALVTARRIEDLFITHRGGRDERLNAVQAILREVMRANLTGSTDWKGPGEPNYHERGE